MMVILRSDRNNESEMKIIKKCNLLCNFDNEMYSFLVFLDVPKNL